MTAARPRFVAVVRRVLAAVLVLLGLAACAGSPPRGAPSEPEIAVRVVEDRGITGHEAVIPLPAPSAVVERWLLDFDRVAADRPNVLEAALIRAGPPVWTARFRLRGMFGVDPTALVETTRRPEGASVTLSFEAVETSFGLGPMWGSYRLVPAPDGGTILHHRLFFDSPFVSNDARERDMREDARAIRAAFRDRRR